MGYQHTQRGPWRFLGYAIALAMAPVFWLAGADLTALLVIGGSVILVVALCEGFSRLTIRDDGDRLVASFGPPPVWWTQIPYREIESVRPGRSTVLDGWGVHYFPGRGTIYNVWGFDCVEVTTPRRTVRLGTDDLDALVAFLKERQAQFRGPR